ncbi:hypothetical protein [Okeania sp. SIO2B9]|uniref:hypothetical protein n=1 Tax=Okeania sp. SIO2B9 TaxID=2607782 RepID=UPI00142C7EAF|nr:hypothetical protein [Okeania sp. SIO2B9]NES90343.1 hypothetical protein [Okeania sp. SIO2B9]
MQTQTHQLTLAEIQEWLVSYLAEILEIDKKEVDIKEPFLDYGLELIYKVNLKLASRLTIR